MSLEVGAVLDGRWSVRRLVAHGDQGSLYEVAHVHLHRAASLLTAPKEHARTLLAEAKLRDSIPHPNMLRVVDVAEMTDGGACVIGGVLAGRLLDGLMVARGSFGSDEALPIALAIADALGSAHALGVAHGALSPASVIVRADGALVLDLGIFPTPLGGLTGPLASIPYTAKERLRGGASASPACDVFAVSAILAEMLSGEPASEWPRRKKPDLPDSVAKVIALGLTESLRTRYPTLSTFAGALREAMSGSALPPSLPPPPRRRFARASYVSPVRLRLADGVSLDGRCEDISEGGMLVVATGTVAAGDTALVRFSLPCSGRVVSEPAKVSWVKSSAKGKIAFGVQFDSPADRALEDVRAYVKLAGIEVDDETT